MSFFFKFTILIRTVIFIVEFTQIVFYTNTFTFKYIFYFKHVLIIQK